MGGGHVFTFPMYFFEEGKVIVKGNSGTLAVHMKALAKNSTACLNKGGGREA